MRRLGAGYLAAALAAAIGASLAAAPARTQEPGLELTLEAAQDAAQDSTPASSQVSRQASAQESNPACPGNPNALGTSRLLAIDPADYPRLGRMQYPNSLPLADKEVVITFDDGPLPPYSNQVLDILASECVKVTYFLVGSMARAYPAVVRRMFLEGHTIGTHSEDHPFHFGSLPIEKMRQEIDRGIADVSAALGDPRGVAPFFRIPGLDRSNVLESELAARSLAVFSSDTVADDWHHHIKPQQIVTLALSRLETRGKGILLLHDIHPTTVAALPGLLKELKDQGFHVVQVVPVAAPQIETASRPRSWMLASTMPGQLTIDGGGAEPSWPQSSEDSIAADAVALPAPDASAFEPDAGLAADSGEIKWPDRPVAAAPSTDPQPTAEHTKTAMRENGAGSTRRRRVAATGSADHERLRPERAHDRRHARAKPSDGQHADLTSRIHAFAALFTPARPSAH